MVGAVAPVGRRVLVCDDERHIVRLIQINLERQGYAVTCAYGGREAIALLEGREFDLAVIDRDMPGVSGSEVLAWIRANERTKSLRVVMLDKERHDDEPPDPDGGSDPMADQAVRSGASPRLLTASRAVEYETG